MKDIKRCETGVKLEKVIPQKSFRGRGSLTPGNRGYGPMRARGRVTFKVKPNTLPTNSEQSSYGRFGYQHPVMAKKKKTPAFTPTNLKRIDQINPCDLVKNSVHAWKALTGLWYYKQCRATQLI